MSTYTPEEQKLLEHYAGLAMQGVLMNEELEKGTRKVSDDRNMGQGEIVAQYAFEISEAMLKERSKRV